MIAFSSRITKGFIGLKIVNPLRLRTEDQGESGNPGANRLACFAPAATGWAKLRKRVWFPSGDMSIPLGRNRAVGRPGKHACNPAMALECSSRLRTERKKASKGRMSASSSIVNLGELTKPATVLIEKISEAIGGIFRPHQIRRIAEAEAQADRIKALSQIEITELQRAQCTGSSLRRQRSSRT